jgi:hypothetical protein
MGHQQQVRDDEGRRGGKEMLSHDVPFLLVRIEKR